MKTRDLIQEVYFEAKPEELYDALMTAEQHAAFTEGEAKIDPNPGGQFTVYNGYIVGKNILLERGKMIVQEWRAIEENWPDYHFSTVQFKMAYLDGGTYLTFIHKGIPEEYVESISNGWEEYYWNPLKAFFAA
ncbi:SRPBCC domain-containing protein [bacterium SCSIO 12741]|nr:SRPBCC domain-containing protein [bacterium SCSIO 12741]